MTADGDEELEELLLGADVGVRATGLLVERIRRAGGDRRATLEGEIARLLGAGRGGTSAAGRETVGGDDCRGQRLGQDDDHR